MDSNTLDALALYSKASKSEKFGSEVIATYNWQTMCLINNWAQKMWRIHY